MSTKHFGFAVNLTAEQLKKMSHRAKTCFSYITVDGEIWKNRYELIEDYVWLAQNSNGEWLPADEEDIKRLDSFDLSVLVDINR